MAEIDTRANGTSGTDRHDAWILSCDAWLSQGAYIVLPVNPQQLSFDLGVRTSNELTRAAQLIYIWRYVGNSSALIKPTIKITANSGYIVPSFDPAIITECAALVAEKVAVTRTARSAGIADPDATGTALRDQFDQQAEDIAIARASYDQQLQDKYSARIPQPEDTRDYISSGVYKQVGASLRANPSLTDTGLAGTGNLPDLYSEANKHVPIGVQNLYALFSLADERRIRKTSESSGTKNQNGQTENRVMLVISTMVFPRLVLHGWFGESGISYTESADDPGNFDVSFDFVVTDTNPPMSYGGWDSLVSSYRAGITDTGSTLQFAQQQWPQGTSAQTPKR